MMLCRHRAAIAAAVTLLAACSGGSSNDPGDAAVIQTDMGTDATAAMDAASGSDASTSADAGEDVLVIGDVGTPNMFMQRCNGQMANEWPFHDTVSTGNVTVTDMGTYFEATVDASAGGTSQSVNNPFIYLDLDVSDKVAINDFQSWENSDWDLAFKRVVIRSNSGDSGPGGVRVAKMSNTSFDQVTSAPVNDSAYKTDVSLDDMCMVRLDPIGQPLTAFNDLNTNNPSGTDSWYSYSTQGGGGGVSPIDTDVYIVQSSKGTYYKVAIKAWASGVFTLDWAALQ